MGLLCSNPINLCSCASSPPGLCIHSVSSNNSISALVCTSVPQTPITAPPTNCQPTLKLLIDTAISNNPALILNKNFPAVESITWDYEVTYDGITIYSESNMINVNDPTGALLDIYLQLQNPVWQYSSTAGGYVSPYNGSVSPRLSPQVVATLSISSKNVYKLGTTTQVIFYEAN